MMQNKRYNQFVRMLEKKGGWENAYRPDENYILTTPMRWTQLLLDKAVLTSERIADEVLTSVMGSESSSFSQNQFFGVLTDVLEDVKRAAEPVTGPLIQQLQERFDQISTDPRMAGVTGTIDSLRDQVLQYLNEVETALDIEVEDIPSLLNR